MGDALSNARVDATGLWCVMQMATGRSVLMCALLLTMAAGNRCTAQPIIESFETGFGGWTPQAFITEPESIPWEWSVTRSQGQASDGEWSLDFTASGVHDQGTVWVERSVELTAGGWVLDLQFDFWSQYDATIGTWEKVAFAGDFDPNVRSDFRVLGLQDIAGWKTYSMSETVWLDAAGPVWFAVGFSIVFETAIRTHYFDLVQVGWTLICPVRSVTWAGIKALYN